MEKNNQKALGFLLILFLTMTYKEMVWDPYFVAPKATTVAEPNANVTSANVTGAAAPNTTAPSPTTTTANSTGAVQNPNQLSAALNTSQVAQAPRATSPSDAEIEAAGFAILENDAVYLKISHLGGRIYQFQLKKFFKNRDKDSPIFDIVSHIDSQPLPFGVNTGGENDSWVTYKNISTAREGILLTGVLPDGRGITKQIGVTDKNYLIDLKVELSAPPANGSKMEVEWSRYLAKNRKIF